MVAGQLFGQELQRYGAAQAGVVRLAHHTHAATTQFLENVIV